MHVDPLAPPADLRGPGEDAQRSPSGLRERVLSPGHGDRRPRVNDRVRIHYTGWTAAGQVFATTRKQAEPRLVDLARLPPGFREGISHMVVGERRRLWIPGRLGFAGRPDQPQGPLVIDVELVAIESGPLH